MGITPLVWGREAWHFIHYVALSFPDNPTEDEKKEYLKFLESLQYILPCPICADNFKKKMEAHPPVLENRKSFFRWTVDVHNSVNESNGKEKISYEEALRRINSNSIRKDMKAIDITNGILLSAGLTTIIFYITKKLIK